ncbi:MAG: response regulator transcription factor [Myxococcota bacterium]|nr:response regulator transcription factor [Myxococcota bacterium]
MTGNTATPSKILLIEDDPIIADGLMDNLKFDGYKTRCEADGQLGIDAALNWHPNLILLDIMLPRKNGYEVIKILRKRNVTCPVIMLTAKGEEFDRCLGLDLGADDYVVKPFSINELLSRIQAHLRRSQSFYGQTRQLSFSNVRVDFECHKLYVDEIEQPVTTTELFVLKYLSEREGRVVTRDQIIDGVWGHGYFGTTRTVDNFIRNLRLKIEPVPEQPIYIKTIRGVGYMFQS